MSTSFVVQNASQLRDTLLDLLRAQYEEFGESIDTDEESDAYRQAHAFALCTEIVQARLVVTEAAIFADTALTEDLEHHARIFGVTRKPATAARLQFRTSNGGAGVATYPLAGATINDSDGTKYLPVDGAGVALTDLTTDVLGSVTFFADALSTGAATNRAPGNDLVWSTAPAGLLPTAEVLAVVRSGADAESDFDLAQRLLAYLRSRPAAGNNADWQSWALAVAGIRQAFVYPATNPTVASANRTPGAVTVVVLPDREVNDGIASSGDVDNVFGYIEGTRDASGNLLEGDARSRQKRFCSLDSNDIIIVAATPVPQDVTMNVTIAGDEVVPTWSAFTTGVGSTSTKIEVTTNPVTAGVAAQQWVAVSSPLVVGGWEIRRVATRDATSITLDQPLLAVPGAGQSLVRAWSGWEAARDTLIDVFHGLGPGDYSAANNGPTRFPGTTEMGPDRLFVSALLSAVVGFARGSSLVSGVAGVIDGTVVTPASSVRADPFELLIPQTITFVPSN
jgi:uncharacterized phage protein gp47/JayE